jgi:hypothetical protein
MEATASDDEFIDDRDEDEMSDTSWGHPDEGEGEDDF